MSNSLVRVVARHSSDVVMSVLLAVVAFDVGAVPAILLATKLNVFVAPVALTTDVLTFPLWVWYVIGVRWAGQAAAWLGLDRGDVARAVDAAGAWAASIPPSTSSRSADVATDGGEES